MNNRINRLLLGSILSSAMLWPTGAWAQAATPVATEDAQTAAPDATEGARTATPDATETARADAPEAMVAAQTDTPAAAAAVQPATDETDEPTEEIVVTGSLFRRVNSETPSPVTVLTSQQLDDRGITTVADAIRSVSADNSGSIPTAFSNGFAYGASGVSLRGLSVNSTLTLFDGLRGAYYPLADDGQKSFVDLNTIPNVAVERIEVLRDGASSTYGADAIGGVVNVITRKEYQGVEIEGSAGITDRGDGASRRLSLLAGTGDLQEDGFSAYIGAEYQSDNVIWARDRGFPYNTFDLSSLTCTAGGASEPCFNGNPGVITAGNTVSAVVRRANQTFPGNIFASTSVPGATFEVLNPDGCAPGTIPHSASNGDYCEQNIASDYGAIQPKQRRIGVTARGSVVLGDGFEGYGMATYAENRVDAPGYSAGIRQRTPFLTTTQIVLPALLRNGQLNPNNPYAADGDAAQIYYRFGDIPASATTSSKTYRGAIGLTGDITDRINFGLDFTAMRTDLDITQRGYLNVEGLTDAILDGTYNFVNPELNSDAIRAQISPDVKFRATSTLIQGQGSVTAELAELPGGPLMAGAGIAVRREMVSNPSANPVGETLGLNSVSTAGEHTVSAVYAELQAPVSSMLELNASGRFDHYSEGFSNFSPKLGFKFTPIRQLALRGTYSRGFRAPQFGETGGATTGYISAPPLPCSIILAHGGTGTATACSGGSAYVSGIQSLGLTTAGTDDLKPEKSRSFTVGLIAQPLPWLSFTADFYAIKKTDLIVGGPDYGLALAAYYAGDPLPDGYTVILNGPDPDFPNAPRTVAFINAPYVNAASLQTRGFDLTARSRLSLGSGISWESIVEATRILKFTIDSGGVTQSFVGTQGPYVLSSGAGTPAWRGNWSNTLDFGRARLNMTASYTSGYKSTADDTTGAGTAGDCANALYDPSFCKTKSFINVDLNGSIDVGKKLTLFGSAFNLFDAKAPFNPANYAGINYNPTYSQSGVVGRSFRAGARVRF